jgi:glycosyltransferase involved in cell wall biosynthesis
MWGRLIARLAGVPRVGCSVRSIPQNLGLIRDNFLLLMNKLSDFIVCNSKAAAIKTIQCNTLDQNKVVVIYNGIPAGFDQKEMCGKSTGDGIVIGLVARLVPVKDISTLLKAFAEICVNHNVKLVIVGDGPSRNDLKNEAVSLCIVEKVCFLGERADAKEIIKTFDIGVLTSQYEGLSNAIMEYMQAGKPVVATRVGGNPELVTDGVTGYLFNFGDISHLANILKYFVSNPEKIITMGGNGRNIIAKNFSVERMVCNWEQVLFSGWPYQSAICRKPEILHDTPCGRNGTTSQQDVESDRVEHMTVDKTRSTAGKYREAGYESRQMMGIEYVFG